MHFFGIAIIGLLGSAVILGVLYNLLEILRKPRSNKFVTGLASALIIIGALGFFGAGLSCAGGLDWLPPSFEWPVGYASGVVAMPDGTHVVPHFPSGRIQVYDRNWHFQRGWRVDALGGEFKLLAASSDVVHVIPSRGNLRYVYRLSGELVSSRDFSRSDYESFPVDGKSCIVPTPFWLWTFSSPIYSWCAFALGGVLLGLATRTKATA